MHLMKQNEGILSEENIKKKYRLQLVISVLVNTYKIKCCDNKWK